jgi:hypothetical protein
VSFPEHFCFSGSNNSSEEEISLQWNRIEPWKQDRTTQALEMLYFSVILCKRQCFIMLSVYTIRVWYNYTRFFLTTCFSLMGASSGMLGFIQSSFCFLLLSPHWPEFTHWECVVCMVFCPFLWNTSILFTVMYKILKY